MDKRFFLYAICLLLFFFTTGGVLVAGGNKEAPEIQSEIPDLEIPEEETPSIFPFSLWKDDKAVITLQEMFDAMPEDIPAIAIVPSEISDGIQDSEAQDIINDLTEVFIRLELFRPFSVTEWLTESYTNEEQNIIALVKKIAYEQFAVKMIVTSSFRKINGKTILRLGFYDINDPLNPIYFMREFSDYEDWKQKLPDLIFEIKLRSDNPLEPFRTSSIFVRNFPTKLYLYSEIDSGEFEFTNISLLHVGNQDFRTGEDFIKDLLTYELYSMQMVGVIADDMIQYRTDIVKSPCEYSIDGEFRISKEFQILVFRIYKHNASGQATKLFEYHVPVDGVEVESIRQALRYTTKLVYDQILSENDLEKISYNNIDFSKYGDVLYFNNFYIGNPVQDGFCLPVGCHWFSVLKYNDKGKRVSGMINTANTAIFVSPLGGNVDLYDRKTARHIQALLSAEEEYVKKYISGLFLVLILSSCATEAPKKDVFVLTELLPMRVDKQETEVEEEVEVEIIEVEPEFLYGVIVEIEVQRGEQKYVYVKTENEAVGLPKGTEGEICEDESWAKQVGKFKIIEEYPGYYYAELVELFYTVRIEQPVRIEKKK